MTISSLSRKQQLSQMKVLALSLVKYLEQAVNGEEGRLSDSEFSFQLITLNYLLTIYQTSITNSLLEELTTAQITYQTDKTQPLILNTSHLMSRKIEETFESYKELTQEDRDIIFNQIINYCRIFYRTKRLETHPLY